MNDLRLINVKSDRLDKNGKPFTDLYLVWTYEGVEYRVRVRPQFYRDFDKLYALSLSTSETQANANM